jgi:hypothetical protein
MNLKISFFAIFVLLLANSMFAQKPVKGTRILDRPVRYVDGPDGTYEAPSPEKKGRKAVLYIVYSDRDNNTTYESPKSGAKVKETIGFMQPFFVVEDAEDYVHIVEFNAKAYDLLNKKITSDLKDYGWVHKDKMLLWQHAMIDKKTRFTKKCLAVNSLKTLQNVEQYAKDDNLRLYNEPKLGKENNADVRLYNFLYVYDEEAGYVLIGKSIKFEPGSKDVILGWVNKDIIQIWDQRMALEPKGGGAGQARKNNDTPIRIYTEEKDARGYQQRGKLYEGGTRLPFSDSWEKEYPAEWKRLPIIEFPKDGAEILHTGVISKVYNDRGEEILDIDEQYKITKDYERLRKEKSNINIVFVVDGSPTMSKYKTPIMQAIYNSTARLDQLSNNTAPEFGAVFYRNPAEELCGNKEVEVIELTGNERDIGRRLEEEFNKPACSVPQKYASLDKAINAALGLFLKSKQIEQTNVMVIIGGEGYSPASGVKKFELIDKLAKAHCSMMCFQPESNGDDSFFLFTNQVRDLMSLSAEEIKKSYAELASKTTEVGYINADDFEMVRLDCPQAAPLPGEIVWVAANQPMDAERLQSRIEGIVTETMESNAHIFARGDSKVTGMGERFEMDEGTLHFLSQMKIDKEMIKKTSDRNIQFFVEGYTPKKLMGAQEEQYRYVVLLEDREFSDLIDDFERLAVDGKEYREYRDLIEVAYKSMVMSMFGRGESEDIVKELDLSDINARLNGLASAKGTRLLDFKLADIHDEGLVSDDRIAAISTYFVDQLVSLNQFRNDPTKSFLSGGFRYYWVPQDLLP